MNRDEIRLSEIQTYKIFYKNKLKETTNKHEKDLIKVQLDRLNDEQKDILKRCNAL